MGRDGTGEALKRGEDRFTGILSAATKTVARTSSQPHIDANLLLSPARHAGPVDRDGGHPAEAVLSGRRTGSATGLSSLETGVRGEVVEKGADAGRQVAAFADEHGLDRFGIAGVGVLQDGDKAS